MGKATAIRDTVEFGAALRVDHDPVVAFSTFLEGVREGLVPNREPAVVQLVGMKIAQEFPVPGCDFGNGLRHHEGAPLLGKGLAGRRQRKSKAETRKEEDGLANRPERCTGHSAELIGRVVGEAALKRDSIYLQEILAIMLHQGELAAVAEVGFG